MQQTTNINPPKYRLKKKKKSLFDITFVVETLPDMAGRIFRRGLPCATVEYNSLTLILSSHFLFLLSLKNM